MNHEIIIDKWRDRSRASRDMAELSIDRDPKTVDLDDEIDPPRPLAEHLGTRIAPGAIGPGAIEEPCRDCPEGMEW